MDMWYVLEAPRGGAASAQSAAERKLRRQQYQEERLAGLAKEGNGGEGVSASTSRLLWDPFMFKDCLTMIVVLSENRSVRLTVGNVNEQFGSTFSNGKCPPGWPTIVRRIKLCHPPRLEQAVDSVDAVSRSFLVGRK